MENSIKERLFKQKIMENKKGRGHRNYIARKTMACQTREDANQKHKNSIDYANTIGLAAKLQRTGRTENLTEKEIKKLRNGSYD